MTYKWETPDVLLVNGDCIEGRQERQGGAELLTNDRNVQCNMAVKSIIEWNAKKVLMTFGTAYHTGSEAEDFEYTIANQLNAEIEGRLFFEIEGMTIDARHKVGVSSIPHGRATSLLRDIAWNIIKSGLNEEPRANIIIRSHVHYHLWVEQPDRVAFTTPALQLSRGRYGSRECAGETHWGAIRLTIDNGKITGRDIWIHRLHANKPRIFRIK